MLKTRINYWNCSKIADLIRGTKKPYALELGSWDRWHKEAKKSHPFRYWIAESGLKTLQDIIYLPVDVYNNIRIYIHNRWIDSSHLIKTGLKPGQYYDLDTKILHGMFYELADLVEIEYSHLSKWNNKKQYTFIGGRCIEAGLDYLDWASKLTYDTDYGLRKGDKGFGEPTPQAITAQKTLELYNWWKNRANRPDPFDLYNKEKDGNNYIRKIEKIERAYDKEDTKMLIELIKIRGGLWT